MNKKELLQLNKEQAQKQIEQINAMECIVLFPVFCRIVEKLKPENVSIMINPQMLANKEYCQAIMEGLEQYFGEGEKLAIKSEPGKEFEVVDLNKPITNATDNPDLSKFNV